MPCIICRRRLAALPLPVCEECKQAAKERECWKPRGVARRISQRPRYTPRPQTEAPETD